MKIITLLTFCFIAISSNVFASYERKGISPFLGIGASFDDTKIKAYNQATDFATQISASERSVNLAGSAGFKINIGNFFIGPRFTIYTTNKDLKLNPVPGFEVAVKNSIRYEGDIMLGFYYKKTATYLFVGRSVLHFDEAINATPALIKIEATQSFAGIGLEYYPVKYLSVFAEFSAYYANRNNIDVRVDGVYLTSSEKRVVDPKIISTKVNLGARIFPIG